MKTLLSFFLALFLLMTTASQAQQQPSVFESASLAKAADGSPCVQLSWKKGSENTDYYLVERSTDGKNFKQIALVFTAEDPAFRNYQFRDKTYAAAGGNPYYRIALVSPEKTLTYLPMQQANVANAAVVNVPASSSLASRN